MVHNRYIIPINTVGTSIQRRNISFRFNSPISEEGEEILNVTPGLSNRNGLDGENQYLLTTFATLFDF